MQQDQQVLFDRYRWLFWVVIVIIFVVGAAIRFLDLKDAPLDFHPTRQLHSALIARGMYYQNLETVPEWKRQTAVQQWKREGLIEPPVMERLSALTYQLIGQEALWIPRVYAILFWLLGGLALLLLVRDLIGNNAAVFAVLYYLIMPYPALASRSFQPDPLMVALIIFALWALVRWQNTAKWKWAVLAGLFGGLSIFIKSVAVFPIALGFTGLVLMHLGIKKAIRSHQVWVMAGLAVFPYVLFHVYGIYIIGDLQSQFSLRFFPQLWRDLGFWLRWNNMINDVVGLPYFLAAILGSFLLRRKPHRTLLLALWAGYFLYGLTLSYHISTHDYYQLPLVPIVAIGLGAVFGQLVQSLRGKAWLNMAVILAILSYFLLINAYEVRKTLKRTSYASERQLWSQMADLFDPDDSIIGITQDYGYRMAYWAWRTPTHWMTSADFALRELAGQEFDLESFFYEQIEGKDYFLVTMFDEFDQQPQVKQILDKNFPVFQQGEGFIIYDLNPTTGSR